MVISKFGATFQQFVNFIHSETSPEIVQILKNLRDSLAADERLKYFGPEESFPLIPVCKEEPDVVVMTFDEDHEDVKYVLQKASIF